MLLRVKDARRCFKFVHCIRIMVSSFFYRHNSILLSTGSRTHTRYLLIQATAWSDDQKREVSIFRVDVIES